MGQQKLEKHKNSCDDICQIFEIKWTIQIREVDCWLSSVLFFWIWNY